MTQVSTFVPRGWPHEYGQWVVGVYRHLQDKGQTGAPVYLNADEDDFNRIAILGSIRAGATSIVDFVETYSKDKNLTADESKALLVFLKDCLDKKKLARVKDVIYDKVTGIIKDIPALVYTKSNKHFTLKNIDKRISTLKSLAPKKPNNATVRHKEIKETINDDSESEEE
jgi:hypothetical protein